MFAKMQILCSVVTLLSCNQSATNLDKKSYLIGQFATANHTVLDEYDSCVFVSYLKHEYTSDDNTNEQNQQAELLQYGTCPYSNFSFLVSESPLTSELEFYGHFDIYYMRYSPVLEDSGKFISFTASKLTPFIKQRVKHVEDSQEVKNVIGSLYMELNNGVVEPIFDKTWTLDALESHISEDTYNAIVNFVGKDYTILEGSNFGIAVFSWTNEDGKLSVKEGIVPYRRWPHFQSDAVPENLDCGMR